MRMEKDCYNNNNDKTAFEAVASAHLGIDVAKAKLDVALLRQGKVKSKVVENKPSGYIALLAWLHAQGILPGQLHVCLEATGPYSEAVAMFLADSGCTVSIVNPARIKGFGMSELVRNKTDEVDAALIARFCATMQPEPWTAPSAEQRKLRALVDRLQALQDNHQQESNRLQGLAQSDEAVKASIEQHLAYLHSAIKTLQAEIDDHIDRHPDLKRDAQLLDSIDAIGGITASKVLAYAGDISRFASAKAFSAFIGVAPRQKRSGTLKGRTVMGKGGSNALRHALFMPAMVAMRYNSHVKQLSERLKVKGMKGKAVIGAAMHKLAHLIYGVLKSGKPYDKTRGLHQDPQQPQQPQQAMQATQYAPATV
jgi:transposase